MARTQTLVQLSDELLAGIDRRRASEGGRRSRSELIREAIVAYLADDREAAIDAQIVEAYRAQPPAETDALLDLGARAMVEAEPWDTP